MVIRAPVITRAARVLIAAAILCSVIPRTLSAQDTNYWTQQYGTRAELLGGAVVGSLSDLSATYYNPGVLSLIDNPSVLLSAKAFEYQTISLVEAGLDDRDINSTRFGTAPSLFTGLLPSKWLTGQLAYVFLTRSQFEFRIVERGEGTGEALDPPPGAEFIAGETISEQNLNENWGGLTWTHAFTDQIGFGLTQFFGYRGQRTRGQTVAQASAGNTQGGTSVLVREFDYWHYRLITKLGVAYDASPLTLGIAVTLPSVSLFGDGKTYDNVSSVGFDLDNSGTANSFLASNSQENLSPAYKSPFSLAAGASYTFYKTAVHVSMEWFDNIPEYTVLPAEPFPVQTTGMTVDPSVTAEMDDVLNFGIGLEHALRERMGFYGSFTTDFSGAVAGSETRHTVSTWDIYHVNLGAAFTVSGLELTLGTGYGWGSDTVQTVDLGGGSEADGLIGARKDTEVQYSKLKFFFGFAFTL